MTLDTGYEASSIELVEDALDALSPASSEEVFIATRDVDARSIAVVAAARADAGGGGGSDDQTAAEVPFTPAGGIAATNVQTALQELDTEKATAADLSAHIGDTSDAHDASAISIADSGGYFTATDVEAALQELADAALEAVIDGGGSAITTGVKLDLEVPFDCTIVAARLFADQSGSIVIDVWRDTYANFPPVDGDSLTASAPPTLSSAAKSEDTTLAGWTKTLVKGDVLRFNVDSATTVTRVTLSLGVTRR